MTAPTLQEAIENAARELPYCYTVHVCVENGAGWVDLVVPGEGAVAIRPIDGVDLSLAEQVAAAVALAHELRGKR